MNFALQNDDITFMYFQDGVLLAMTQETLTEAEQAELDFVPLKTATGSRTALAEELSVELTPTLVVAHETVSCDYDPHLGYEFCDLEEEPVERFVGANNIIEHLQATLDAYTYAHPE